MIRQRLAATLRALAARRDPPPPSYADTVQALIDEARPFGPIPGHVEAQGVVYIDPPLGDGVVEMLPAAEPGYAWERYRDGWRKVKVEP